MAIDASIPLGVRQQDPFQPMSSLLNMQRGIQGYQIGQQTQESNELALQHQRQQMLEMQAVKQWMSDPANYSDDGGKTLNADKLQGLLKVAPTTGLPIVQNLQRQAAARTEYDSAKSSLEDSDRERLSQFLNGVSASYKPGKLPADMNARLSDALDFFAQQHPGNKRIQDYIAQSKKMIEMGDQSPQAVYEGLERARKSFMSPQTAKEQLSPNAPLIDNNRTLQPTIVNPNRADTGTPVGPAIPKLLAPGEDQKIDVDPRTGKPFMVVRTPQGTAIGIANDQGIQSVQPPMQPEPTNAGVPPASKSSVLASPQEAALRDEATRQIIAARKAASTAPGVRSTLSSLTDLLEKEGVAFGKGSAGWNGMLSALNAAGSVVGMPNIAPQSSTYQEVAAYLDRLANEQAKASGANSVAELHATQSAVGTPVYDASTLKEKIKRTAADMESVVNYRTALDRVVGTENTDPSKKAAFDAKWDSNNDPDIYRLMNAAQRGDQADIAAIKRRRQAEGTWQELQRKAKIIRSLVTGQ